MKLRLGQPVSTTDGPFGEIGDIVVDPRQRTVTHLVVEPHRQHYQARLVPMWLVDVDGDILTVQLDEAHLRQLESVAFSDFVRPGDPIELGDDWEVGTEDVVAMPYYGDSGMGLGYEPAFYGDQISVSYDRIPKGECEIRRRSEVVTSDDRVVGHVDGFLADDDHLTGVVVRAGLPGLRRAVVVPMSSVSKVRSDRISLGLDKDAFGRLPTSADSGAREEPSRFAGFEHRVSRLAHMVHHKASGVADRVQGMVGRGENK